MGASRAIDDFAVAPIHGWTPVQLWMWMLLLIQPWLKGHFEQQLHRLQRALIEVVDEVAVEEGSARFNPLVELGSAAAAPQRNR